MCIAASQSFVRRRQVLERIRAKREVTVKTEDYDDVLEHNEDNRSNIDSGHSQTSANNAVDASDVKSVITEYVLYLCHNVLLMRLQCIDMFLCCILCCS